MTGSPATGYQWRIVVDGHPNSGHWIDVADGDFQNIDCAGRLEFRAKPTSAATARVVGAACEDRQMTAPLRPLEAP